MKRILVSGGAGFLGTHLCKRLLARGNHVVCLDNFRTGHRSSVDGFVSINRFELMEQSVEEPVSGDFDEIYNLACPASPRHYQSDPVQTFKTSIFGILNMLELADRTGAKLLQASTSEVYGDPSVHPQPESYRGNVNPTGIRACYDEGKRGAETLVYDFQRTRGTRVRVARIFNTYGPGMDVEDGRVVSNFVIQALQCKDITIHGDGSQTRSFCYRDDLVDGLLRLMDAPDEVNFPINIGNPYEFTIAELADLIIELTGSASRCTFLPLPEDDPMQRCPDISLAIRYLDWIPKIDLREGLRRTIEYYGAVMKHGRHANVMGKVIS